MSGFTVRTTINHRSCKAPNSELRQVGPGVIDLSILYDLHSRMFHLNNTREPLLYKFNQPFVTRLLNLGQSNVYRIEIEHPISKYTEVHRLVE